MLLIIFVLFHIIKNTNVNEQREAGHSPLVRNALRDEVFGDYDAQFDNVRNQIDNSKNELKSYIDAELHNLRRHLYANHTALYDAINNLKNSYNNNSRREQQNFASIPVTFSDVVVFPGSNEDYNLLIPLLTKSSRCDVCSTCKKNEVCVFKTYQVLKEIVDKYPDWNPPVEIPAKPKLNKLLQDVLTNVTKNVDSGDMFYIVWSVDNKIKHLINPLFLASLKFPTKSGKGKINPALLIALSQGNVDPSLLMMMMQDSDNNSGFDPMLLALGNKDFDPMMLALMKDKKMNPLLFTMLNKKKETGGCSKSNENSNARKNVRRNNQSNGFDGIDPKMLPFLLSAFGDGNDNSELLLMMQLLNSNNNKDKKVSRGCEKAAPVVNDGYGRVVEDKVNDLAAEETFANYEYGKGYGRV